MVYFFLSFTPLTKKSVIQFSFSLSLLWLYFLFYTSLFLSPFFFLSLSTIFSLPLQLSFLTLCLPPVLLHPIPVLSLGNRKWFLSRSRGLEGCTHRPKQRGHCVNPPKIQRRKGRQIMIRNLVSSASLIQTHMHTPCAPMHLSKTFP